jgi:glutaredoxin
MNEIYSRPNCPYCDMAKDVFKKLGVQFEERVVGSDISREDFFEKFPGKRTVPQIIIRGEHIGGYSDLKEWMEKNDLRNFLAG